MNIRPISKLVVFGSALVALAACAPQVPESGQSYQNYMRNATAAPNSAASMAQPMYNDPTQPWAATGLTEQMSAGQSSIPMSFDPAAAAAAFDRADGVAPAATSGASTFVAPATQTPIFTPPASYNAAPAASTGYLDPNRPRGDAPMNIRVESGEMTGRVSGNVSDENDFKAVASRESIASDAERIARNRSQYTIVEPKALPERVGNTGPNIVQYALNTRNNPGEPIYKRSAGLFKKDVNAACAGFASPDLAQQEFLAKGGPDRDRLGVDPDGDGFACGWDPRPFRAVLK